MRRFATITILLLMAALLASPTQARRQKHVFAGPYRAEVYQVVDSDTIRVVADVWPNVQVPALIRVYGVDTPEKFRPRCAAEKARALEATAFVKSLLSPGDIVRVRDVRLGKYAGRVVARLELQQPDGSWADLARLLIEKGYGRPYFGGHKADWCAILNGDQQEQEKEE